MTKRKNVINETDDSESASDYSPTKIKCKRDQKNKKKYEKMKNSNGKSKKLTQRLAKKPEKMKKQGKKSKKEIKRVAKKPEKMKKQG